MKLLELCEPLFQYVARLCRSARMGYAPEMNQVRSDIEKILQTMASEANADAELTRQYEKVELPLIFFVDFMIKESKLSFASAWQELARAQNELAGDEKFFDLLDAELADPSEAATQRLVIYYTCIGLGFTGIYTGQPENILRLMSEISARISGMIDADAETYICPEAYENVDARDFVEPPGAKLVGGGIILIGLLIICSIAYLILFISASSGVADALKTITEFRSASTTTQTPRGGDN
jgi:type IV/VI secretion system ImpK/VasF family protein